MSIIRDWNIAHDLPALRSLLLGTVIVITQTPARDGVKSALFSNSALDNYA